MTKGSRSRRSQRHSRAAGEVTVRRDTEQPAAASQNAPLRSHEVSARAVTGDDLAASQPQPSMRHGIAPGPDTEAATRAKLAAWLLETPPDCAAWAPHAATKLLAAPEPWTGPERRQAHRILKWCPSPCATGSASADPGTALAEPVAHGQAVTPAQPCRSRLVLSLFPGVGLLDAAFEAEGITTVRGPDLLWGGDVRRFHAPSGVFWGVIGGPPCQDFSTLRRDEPTGEGLELLTEFARVVTEAAPEWWLAENVATVPDVRIDGYSWQRIDVDQAWYAPVSRLRHIQFGSRVPAGGCGRLLQIPRGNRHPNPEACALASDDRPWEVVRRLQGLPDDYELPGFTREAAVRAVGNGVPIVLGRVLARAVLAAYGHETGAGPVTDWEAVGSLLVCRCGCGRKLEGRQTYSSARCRKRAQRARDRVTGPPAAVSQ